MWSANLAKVWLRAVVVICLLSVFSGCGAVRDALDKFDAAIAEVRALRESMVGESTRWREQLQKSQLQLTSDVRTILNQDLRDNIDKSIAELGIEIRCDADFVTQNLNSYLQGVENALKNKRDQIRREGLLQGAATPETLIADTIKGAGHIDPRVCHAIPAS